MIAYMMSAGLAVRLRPVTEKYPKCLLQVGGSPILEYWLTAIIKSKEFDKIYVNVHHCADQVENWVKEYSRLMDFPIHIIDERSKLLGTAGTLFWHGEEEDSMVLYTDTYSRSFYNQLKNIASFWKNNPDKPLAGLLTFSLPEDGSAGAIETDFMGIVTSFSEKQGEGIMGWAGYMFCRKDFISHLKQTDTDLARDVFPRICSKMRVLTHVDAYDIGRGLDEYEFANAKIYKAR